MSTAASSLSEVSRRTSAVSPDDEPTRYLYRQMRAPTRRHLDEIDVEDIRRVSSAHYIQELTRTLENAGVVQRQSTLYTATYSPSPSVSPHRHGSAYSIETANFYQNQYISNCKLTDENITAKVRFHDETNADVTSPPIRASRRSARASFRRAASTLQRFRKHVLVFSHKESRIVFVGRSLPPTIRPSSISRGHLLPPISSASSNWAPQSIGRLSAVTQDMCLCGLLSLSLSVHLICCIEVFFSMVLLIQAPDLLTMDGTYFYFLGLLEGEGELLFALHVILCASCVLTALLLYIGSRSGSSLLLIPHLLWQYAFIIISIGISIVLLVLGIRGDMLLPSSVVLGAMLTVPAGVTTASVGKCIHSYFHWCATTLIEAITQEIEISYYL